MITWKVATHGKSTALPAIPLSERRMREEAAAAVRVAEDAVTTVRKVLAGNGRHVGALADSGDALQLATTALAAARTGAASVEALGFVRETIGRDARIIANTVAATIGWDVDAVAPGVIFARLAITAGHGSVARTWAALRAAILAITATVATLTGDDTATVKDARALAEAFARVAKGGE